MKPIPEDALLHPYHCPLDGGKTYETGLGVLTCAKCGIDLLPMAEKDPEFEKRHPGKHLLSISWVVEKT